MAKKVVNNDISNRTVVVMLVVVILVSIVALGVYLNALDKAEPEIVIDAQGQVSLNIDEPVEQAPAEPDAESAEAPIVTDNPEEGEQ
jgi:hypothetical protein